MSHSPGMLCIHRSFRLRLLVWVAALVLTALVPKPGYATSGGAGIGGGPTPSFAVGEIVVSYTDPSRHVRLPGGRVVPRQVLTVIRYPAQGDPSRTDVLAAPPAQAQGPFPLIVFGHGYAVTPSIYDHLLRAWAAAGYVVAAPVFPLSNAAAPGGPDEADLVNQPADMSLVITRVTAASAASRGILARLVTPHEVAVSGQSDGGSTALAVAYNAHYLDRRVRAAVILSGAEISGIGGYGFSSPGPPLLACQGTADTVNMPSSTYSYYHRAQYPKFLLSLLGAAHLGPYTSEQPQLGLVERESIAFLDRYLKHAPGATARMWTDGDVPGVAALSGHG